MELKCTIAIMQASADDVNSQTGVRFHKKKPCRRAHTVAEKTNGQ